MKGWCLRYCKKEDNIRSYISNEPIFLDINKFIEHLKFKIGLEIKVYGKYLTKEFVMPKHIDDYDEKYINDIKNSAYVLYDNNMDTVYWIEVHNVIN